MPGATDLFTYLKNLVGKTPKKQPNVRQIPDTSLIGGSSILKQGKPLQWTIPPNSPWMMTVLEFCFCFCYGFLVFHNFSKVTSPCYYSYRECALLELPECEKRRWKYLPMCMPALCHRPHPEPLLSLDLPQRNWTGTQQQALGAL